MTVDAFDIDYVYKQFKANYNAAIVGGEANWSDLAEAVSFDLSADINGDLVVNQATSPSWSSASWAP